MKYYNVFISHSWDYGEQYEKFISLLKNYEEANDVLFKDYSVPKDDPIHNTKNMKDLRIAIKAQIQPCSIVIILAGVYATYSKWINEEIFISKKDFNKPILAVKPFGNKNVSSTVKDNADEFVSWSSKSIGDSIVKLCA